MEFWLTHDLGLRYLWVDVLWHRTSDDFPSYMALENLSDLFWNTRVWTFQEKLQWRRLLLFADQQVYYKCSEAIRMEEIALETGHVSCSEEARSRKYAWWWTDSMDDEGWQLVELEIYGIVIPSMNIWKAGLPGTVPLVRSRRARTHWADTAQPTRHALHHQRYSDNAGPDEEEIAMTPGDAFSRQANLVSGSRDRNPMYRVGDAVVNVDELEFLR
jgi:hypothetical protein